MYDAEAVCKIQWKSIFRVAEDGMRGSAVTEERVLVFNNDNVWVWVGYYLVYKKIPREWLPSIILEAKPILSTSHIKSHLYSCHTKLKTCFFRIT